MLGGVSRRIGVYGIATVLPSAVSFLFLPILTRQMGKSEFGAIGAFTALFSFLFILYTFYLDRALGRLYFCYEGEARRELIGTLFLSIVFIASAGLLATFGLSPQFERFYPAITARRLDWYATFVFFNVLVYFARTYCTAAEKPAPYLLISAGLSLATVLALLWYVWWRREGLDGWLKGQVVANAMLAVPCIAGIARISTLRFRTGFLREALMYAGPLIPSFAFSWLSGSADRLLVGRIAGMSVNATYGAASQFENILGIVSQPVFMTYSPIFYRLSAGTSEDRAAIQSYSRALLLLFSAASCILILCAPPFVRVVLPPSYRDATGTMAWLVVAGYMMLIAGVAVLGLYFARRSDLVLYTSAGSAITAMVADFALIPYMGRHGAVVGQLLSSAALLIGQLVLAKRVYGVVMSAGAVMRNLTIVVVSAAVVEMQGSDFSALWFALDAPVLGILGFLLFSEREALLGLLSGSPVASPERQAAPELSAAATEGAS